MRQTSFPFDPGFWCQSPQTLSRGARRLYGLIAWYCRLPRGCFARQRVFAAKMGCAIRSISRWVGELVRAGVLAVSRNGPTSATYEILSSLPVAAPFGVSFGVSFPPGPLTESFEGKTTTACVRDICAQSDPRTQPLPERKPALSEGRREIAIPRAVGDSFPRGGANHAAGPGNAASGPGSTVTGGSPRDPEPKPAACAIPITYPEPFQQYILVFARRGKPFNRVDLARAYAAWSGMDQENQAAALGHITKLAAETAVRYIPMPVNHLQSEAWTRVVMVPEKELVLTDKEWELQELRQQMIAEDPEYYEMARGLIFGDED